MRGDTNRLLAAKPFAKWVDALGTKTQAIEFMDVSGFPKTNLFVCFTTDKGLCGGVNSFISRGMRKIAASLTKEGKTFKVVVYGEKGRGQLKRILGDDVVVACTESIHPATFNSLSAFTNEVLKVDPADYQAMHLVYNQFKSAVLYTSTVKTMPSLAGVGLDEPLMGYEFEPETKNEVVADLKEYMVASSAFYSVIENAASEQSARTAAMEGASKNAGELIVALTLKYNKARQTRITTELIEIISGESILVSRCSVLVFIRALRGSLFVPVPFAGASALEKPK
jgi:F-type H+-transporting ATPase subunit gamma